MGFLGIESFKITHVLKYRKIVVFYILVK
uniref:Uncharacterized protein n=1 Tax=Lepeophtheirus salmonis TaxID=72036 RepID=A0A0K2V6E1_LEPSM